MEPQPQLCDGGALWEPSGTGNTSYQIEYEHGEARWSQESYIRVHMYRDNLMLTGSRDYSCHLQHSGGEIVGGARGAESCLCTHPIGEAGFC